MDGDLTCDDSPDLVSMRLPALSLSLRAATVLLYYTLTTKNLSSEIVTAKGNRLAPPQTTTSEHQTNAFSASPMHQWALR